MAEASGERRGSVEMVHFGPHKSWPVYYTSHSSGPGKNATPYWMCVLGVCVACMRVEFLLKTDSGYPKDTGVTYSTWQPLGIPSAIRPIGQLHQSPPSPIPGDRARGKRRGVSARHRSRTRGPTDLQSSFCLVFPISSEIGRLPRVFSAKSEIGHSYEKSIAAYV